MNLNNLKGKVNNIVQLICAFKYFFLVEIVDPCVYLFSVNCFTREDAYSTLSPFAYERQPRLWPSLYNQQFMSMPPMMSPMQMMAPFTHLPAHVVQSVQASQSLHLPTSSQENGAQRKNNRWTDAEEKILIELFGENEEKLRYWSFKSLEWQSIARQLQERCRQENIKSEKSAQQCKNKMANQTKKYKTVKDKLRTTGYGKGGDDEDKETESETELIPKNFNDIDNILGKWEVVNPKHVLESSLYITSSPEIDKDLLDKEALDEEILVAARAQKERDTSGKSTYSADGFEEDNKLVAFAKSLFFKNKSRKRKGTSTIMPNPKSRAGKKLVKKNSRKKAKGGVGAKEQGTVLSFLERAQEKDEAFMERMAKAERESRQQQQKFSTDALAMLGNIQKDVTKGKE